MPDTALDVVQQVISLYDSKEKWCQVYSAMDEKGEAVMPLSPEAKCWCIFGAVVLVTYQKYVHNGIASNLVLDVLDKIVIDKREEVGIVDFNDNVSFEVFMEFLGQAVTEHKSILESVEMPEDDVRWI